MITGINWRHDVPNLRAPLYIGYVFFNSIREHKLYYKRDVGDLLYSVTDACSVRVCYSEPDIREGALSLIRECLKNKGFLKTTEKLMVKRSDSALGCARNIETEKKPGIKQLIRLFREVYDAYTKFFALVLIPELSIDFIEEALDREAARIFQSEKEENISILSTPGESFMEKEKRELLAISRHKDFRKLLKEHAKKYFWIENNYIDTKRMDEDYFIKRMDKIKGAGEDSIKRKKQLLASLRGARYRKIKVLSDIIEFLAYAQDLRKRTVMEISYYINNILQQIGSRKGYGLEQMLLMKPEEIFRLEKTPVPKGVLLNREIKILGYYHKGNINFYEGDEANRIEKAIAPIALKKGCLKGKRAHRGKAKGFVKVIRSVKELHKLKKGDILVTSNTTPDYAPYLSKVKAIITEKGGITCHAAIISRELDVPCIVGIKHITLNLKDGDLVEVDADKGVVRKLEKR